MVANPLMLVLATGVGIMGAELLSRLGSRFLRMFSGEAVQVAIPLVIRLGVFAIIGVQVAAGVNRLQAALELLKSIAP